jgi:hypothetical protein
LALARGQDEPLTLRYSVRSLLMVMTVVAIGFGIVSFALRLKFLSRHNLEAITMFAVLRRRFAG